MKHYKEHIVLPKDFPFVTYTQLLDTRYDRLHRHEYFEITHILEGHGIYYSGDESFEVGAGDLVLSNNATFHFAFADHETEVCTEQVYEFLPIVFDEHLSSQVRSKYLSVFFGGQRILHVGVDPEASPIVELLVSLAQEFNEKALGYEMVISGKLRTLMGLIYRQLFQDNSVSLDSKSEIYRLSPAIAFINTYLHKSITLAQVAKTVHLHPAYFSRIFSSTVGCTFQKYVQKMRLSKAQVLLKHSNKNILDIAIDCGFCNESAFYRSFKQLNQMTPAEYRNMWREQKEQIEENAR